MGWRHIICCTCTTAALVAGQAGVSHGFALQRLAAAMDVSQVALSIPTSALVANVPSRLILPASVDLLGPTTELKIGIPTECDVTIEVADDAGAPLFLAQAHMPAGWQKLGFSGRDSQGNLLANGTYYYTVTADGTSRTMRVVVNR